VVLDGLLLWRGRNALACCSCCLRRSPWWGGSLQGRGCWPAHRGPLAGLFNLVTALWSMRFSLMMIGDLVLDIILLVQILPMTVGWLLLGAYSTGLLISGLAIHRHLLRWVAASFVGLGLPGPCAASLDASPCAPASALASWCRKMQGEHVCGAAGACAVLQERRQATGRDGG
jgi:hypothetical protein